MGACHCSSERKHGLEQPHTAMPDNTLLSNRTLDIKKTPAEVSSEQPEEVAQEVAEEAAASPKGEQQLEEAVAAKVDQHIGGAPWIVKFVPEAAEEVEEEALEAEAPAAPKPNFSGEWKMVRYEGDFETWMKEAGVGWASRKAASAAGFGVGGTVASIQQSEERITIKSKSIKGTTLQELRLDGSEQEDADVVSSKPIKVVVRWEEVDGRATLIVEAPASKNAAGSVSVPLTRRFLDGEGMIAERTNCSGTVVRLFFAKEG